MATNSGSKLDAALTVALVVCAIITVGILVRREFFAPPAMADNGSPVFMDDWKAYLQKGVRMGPTEAKVHILEISDFECPGCANYHEVLKALRKQYPRDVAITYVHFPLPRHQFAVPAARAAECANDQGQFEVMHDELFEQQKYFGVKSWNALAREAGIVDLHAFDACMGNVARSEKRINEGKVVGEMIRLRATPTIIVNGWRFPSPPMPGKLREMIELVLAGKDPVRA